MDKIYYKGDVISLYVKFEYENKILTSLKNAQVRILHQEDGNIYEDLSWTKMQKISPNEYIYNFVIPDDFTNGMYDVIYKAKYKKETLQYIESFYVIDNLPQYNGAIKIFGYIDEYKKGIPLSNVNIKILHNDNLFNSTSVSKLDGSWECYLYPGNYKFIFEKQGFKTQEIVADINDNTNEIQFNNISLVSDNFETLGNGIYEVTDTYILKNNMFLDNLNIEVSNIFKPDKIIAKTKTNNKGKWVLYLDPGYYLLKIYGNTLDMDFYKMMRLKVDDNGNFNFDDITNNVGKKKIPINKGTGTKTYKDIILDKSNKPIVDVQITVYDNLGNMVAQDYTNINGEYELFLNPGQYKLKIYHPNFYKIPLQKLVIKEEDI